MGAARSLLRSIFRTRPTGTASTPRSVVHAWLTRARALQTGEAGLRRRARQRWSWNHQLVVQTPGGPIAAIAADISFGGVALLMERKLDIDARVWLRDLRGSAWVPARVRHLRESEESGVWRLGLEFVLEPDLEEWGPPPAEE